MNYDDLLQAKEQADCVIHRLRQLRLIRKLHKTEQQRLAWYVKESEWINAQIQKVSTQ